MADIIAGSPAPTNPASSAPTYTVDEAAALMTPAKRLLAALAARAAAPRILDIHLDDCESAACTGCEPQHLAQVHLAACAAKAGLSPAEYTRRGLLAEWHHQLDDPAVPYSPYLTLGGQP